MGPSEARPYFSSRRAVAPLNVIIIGAGIAGLSAGIALAQTGHSVTILERVPQITEAGAGIQLAPNATRILRRMGVIEEIMEHMSVLSRVSIRRYDSDEELGSSPLMPAIGIRYGEPMGVIHRGDLQRILLKAALESGCCIRTSQVVVGVHSRFLPQVQVRDALTGMFSWISADLVVAADGINSIVRKQLSTAAEFSDEPMPGGDAAYRLLVPREKIKHDSKLLQMLDQDVAVRYMGPGGHVMAYPVKRNTLYNLVLLHPAKETDQRDIASEDVWSTKAHRKAMLDFYNDWSPAVRAWLRHAEEEILEWRLDTYPAMPRWVRGNVLLLGDACHPMLPYVAQGAAMSIEDAAVLAAALTRTSNVPLALEVYETVRKERADRIAASAASTGRSLHLSDGPEQEKRDDAIRHAVVGGDREDRWCDNEWQDYMWATDVTRDTIENWEQLVGFRPRL
ncbi:FAD-dependent monooxygenase OpS4 [Colletotrichum gloeosporioides]|uniref:FAD-dependent monooxygenase OpS4 n=1 Tax=Colletotrichum gloeosporioides TaxID=474922 RepID=A0A8H4CS11_COLGL|nr:FAD-dependent monooxygenase OpS4 [Colletotrichum gloeosporioides]KAF3809053.1 FAD-dependent monooxygenase OpS4 [Colletotrichum gloeosporioides]